MLRRFVIFLSILISVIGILLLIAYSAITYRVGAPNFTKNGLLWPQMNLSIGVLKDVEVQWNRSISIQSALIDIETQPKENSSSSTYNWRDYIQTVTIENVQIQKNDRLIAQNLEGTLHPTIALGNEWMSLSKSNEEWIVIAKINKDHLQAYGFDIDGQFKCSFRSKSTYGPWTGVVEHIRINHPLFGTTLEVPNLKLELAKNPSGWNAKANNAQSELLISFGKSDWAVKYSMAAQDLVNWFQPEIPHTKISGFWNGEITNKSASIAMESLAFEGQLYAIHRLQSGQPITYKPIHSDSTRLIGPNITDWVPYPKLGWLSKAVVAGEDAPFHSHNGFNLEGLNRALNEIRKNTEHPIGGSSITQQVAKNLFTGNKPTLQRKIQEMIYTLALEDTLSKEAIMSLYLNSIEFGDQIYGIQQASEQYFLKSPDNLSIKEAVFLASILPNPRSGYRSAKLGTPPNKRMQAILQNLLDGKHITQQQFYRANRETLRLLLPVE